MPSKSYASIYCLDYVADICDPIIEAYRLTRTLPLTSELKAYFKKSVESELERGDMIYIPTGSNKVVKYIRFIWDGTEFVSCVKDGHDKIPNSFQVVTEFPADYWYTPGGDPRDNWCVRDNMNFDHTPFVDEIAQNIVVSNYGLPTATSTFKYKDETWSVIFDFSIISAVMDRLPEGQRTLQNAFKKSSVDWTARPFPLANTKSMIALAGPHTLFCHFG